MTIPLYLGVCFGLIVCVRVRSVRACVRVCVDIWLPQRDPSFGRVIDANWVRSDKVKLNKKF